MEYLLNDYFPILPLWQIIVTNQDIKSVKRCIHIRYSMALLSKWHENTQQNIQFCYNKHTFCIYFKNPHQNTCYFIYSTSIYVDGSLRCIWYKAIIHLFITNQFCVTYVTHNDVDKLLILCLPFLIWFHCNVHVMNVLSSAFCYFCPVCVDAFILGKMQDGNMENNQTKGNLLSLYRWFERSPWFYSSVHTGSDVSSSVCCASHVCVRVPVLVQFYNHFNDRVYISPVVLALGLLTPLQTKISRGFDSFQVIVKVVFKYWQQKCIFHLCIWLAAACINKYFAFKFCSQDSLA